MIIYKITNKINGKIYIGQTQQKLYVRWSQHKHHARKNTSKGVLSLAIRKYEANNFEIKTIVKCNNIDEMNHRETYYIKLSNCLAPNGYNLDSGGKNNAMHEDTKKKLSAARMGKKRGPFTEEHKKNISIANKGKNLGIPLSEETRIKISIANSGAKKS